MPLQYNLFDTMNNGETWKEQVCEGVVVLRQFAVGKAPQILQTANNCIGVTRNNKPVRNIEVLFNIEESSLELKVFIIV